MRQKVGGMYRVVYDKSDISRVLPIHVTDGSIVIVDNKGSKAASAYIFVRLVLGEMTTSSRRFAWSADMPFPIHPSVLEEIE